MRDGSVIVKSDDEYSAKVPVLSYACLCLQKKWKKLMKVKPTEPDLEALRAAFDAQPGHARLRTLTTLHDEAQLLVWKTLKELRKFVMAKEEQVEFCCCRVVWMCVFV